MFNLVLLLFLMFGFFMGLKRGLILQILHLVGFIVAFAVAAMYCDDLGPKLALWIPYSELPESTWASFLQTLPLEKGFYNAVAFVLIFIAVKIFMQIIASMLDFVASIPVINSVNKLLGAVLGFIEVYLIAFIILYILALTPVETVQGWITGSPIALFIVEQTPYFSGKILDLWFSFMEDK